jgi:regulatory protein
MSPEILSALKEASSRLILHVRGPVPADTMAKLQMSLKARALKYLSAREHSRIELARKLARYAQDGDEVEALLDELEAAKLLSETRFSESLVHRRAARYGNNRIISELQSHGIDGEALSHIKADLGRDEITRAREVWRKKFPHPPADAAERAKQMRFLQQRGFSLRAIQGAIQGTSDD